MQSAKPIACQGPCCAAAKLLLLQLPYHTGTRIEVRPVEPTPANDIGLDLASSGMEKAGCSSNSSTAAQQRLQQQKQHRELARRHLCVECDGEVVGCAPLTVEVLPGAIRFCM